MYNDNMIWSHKCFLRFNCSNTFCEPAIDNLSLVGRQCLRAPNSICTMELRRGFWYFFITADLPLKFKLDKWFSGGDSELRNHPSLPWPPCGYPSHEVASLQPPIFLGCEFFVLRDQICASLSFAIPSGASRVLCGTGGGLSIGISGISLETGQGLRDS